MDIPRRRTDVRKRLYRYRSKDYFNRVHLYYGGTKQCDHWHQGAGFVTSHVAFSLEFERALQSVSPAATLPYWDFTIESTFYTPESWRDSPIFADDWFGAASPANDLHTVTEGRWAFVPAMTAARNFSHVANSYGILRAPWNNDPTPFMTRHRKIYGYENNMKPCARGAGLVLRGSSTRAVVPSRPAARRRRGPLSRDAAPPRPALPRRDAAAARSPATRRRCGRLS